MNPLGASPGETAGESGEADGAGGAGETAVDDLCFTARALAQTHPMTEAAYLYRQGCHEAERSRQPATEPADWASTALLVGYCLRRAEEQRAGTEPAATEPAETGVELVGTGCAEEKPPPPPEPLKETGVEPAGTERAGGAEAESLAAGLDDLAPAIAAVAESLRTGEAGRVTLLDPALTVSALDRVIATELDKRWEHLREQLDDQEWSELEDYIAWWTVHGYALRAVEFP